MEKSKRHLFYLALASYWVLIVFLPKFGHSWDNHCWGLWAEIIQNNGIASAYNSDSPINYLPLYLYVLKVYALIVPHSALFEMTYGLKALALLFDVGSMYLLCTLLPKSRKTWLFFLLGLFNIGFIYNAFIWNQVDGILSFLVFSSLIFADQKKATSALILFLLAINFKLQGIVLLPILLALLSSFIAAKKLLRILPILIALEILILWPFILAGNVWNVWEIAKGSMDYYPSISMNAFNFWHLVYSIDLMFKKDSLEFIWGFSHKQIGLSLFIVFSSLVLLPLLIKSIQNLVSKTKQSIDLKNMLISATLIVLLFFYFNTQMHERYIHMAIIFSTALAFLYGAWAQWILLSIAYALSLESICKFTNLNHAQLMLFKPQFIAILYTITLILLAITWLRSQQTKTAI